ncbi:MFS general substrate transporter [Ascoidea rubescens DSM 1968]|uniref:MFS general substrate transporter n=1 Tax=Ascoidea rubescens DSM 1968 TaxID=1344418 RepID=A0A1D2VLL7_9ASCO|nr:MFS general substrate transporter [Ascoidea rubescens DSM 1968]ODV62506.1 MFS general substrate transporter [Ascoidea rubescens DSM 1968]
MKCVKSNLTRINTLDLDNNNSNDHEVKEDLEQQLKNAKDNNDTNKKEESFEVPDGGYGWVIVGAIFLISVVTWGANAGFAVYLAHYLSEDTFEGGTKIDYAVIGGLAFGSGLMIAPLITYLNGLFGFKITMLMGALLGLTAMLLASFATKLWQLYLTQGVVQGFGLAFTYVPSMPIISHYFKKKRTLAAGIAASGSGLGGIFFALVMDRIMRSKGVRWALRSQGIICFVLIIVSISILRDRRDRIQAEFRAIDRAILCSKGFWINTAWITFVILGYVVVQYAISDFTRSLGYSAKQGSINSAMVALGAFVFRPLLGTLADRFGTVTVGGIVYFLCCVLCYVMWVLCRNFATSLFFSILIGGLMGYIWGSLGTIVPRVVGLPKMGVAFGMHWICIGSIGIISPIIGLALRGPVDENSYNPAAYQNPALYCGSMFLATSFFLFLLRAFLIARELVSENTTDSDFGRELAVAVSWKLVFTSMFRRGKTKI